MFSYYFSKVFYHSIIDGTRFVELSVRAHETSAKNCESPYRSAHCFCWFLFVLFAFCFAALSPELLYRLTLPEVAGFKLQVAPSDAATLYRLNDSVFVLKEEARSRTWAIPLAGRVLLRNVTLAAEGVYKCEISTEAPYFDTDYREANLTVIGKLARSPRRPR